MSKSNKKNQKHIKQKAVNSSIKTYFIVFAIIVLTFFTFLNSLKNGFMTSWDDNKYIIENSLIRDFSFDTFKYFFANSYFANYHPLTMISYVFEYKFFSLSSATPYHFDNLLLHLLNVILVFYLIKNLTGKLEIAVVTAVLFAIHPMHVESVAWLSERKDLLYSFFFLLSLQAYFYYLKNRNQIKFLIYCFMFFLLSLLSKSAAAPLPIILILIDYYYGKPINIKNFIEKLPFFLLSLIFGYIAIQTQKNFGATNMAPIFPAFDRLFLVNYSIIFYVIKFFLPINLCSIYYYPIKSGSLLPAEYYLSPLALLLIVFLILKIKEHRKTLIFGALFFFFMLVMVIQIIPLGRSITSDRYTYLPFVGLSMIIGYFYSYFSSKINFKNILNIFFLDVTIVFSATSYYRCEIWQNGITLFSDVAEKNPNQSHAFSALGYAKFEYNDFEGSIDSYNKSLLLKKDAEAFNNRGNAKYRLKLYKEAIIDYDLSIHQDTNYSLAYYNKAATIEQLPSPDYKITEKLYSKAIQIDEKYMLAYNNRGLARYQQNKLKEGLEDCNKALQLAPDYPNAYHNRGIIYFAMKNYKKAIEDYTTAIRLNPEYALAYSNRGVAKYYLNDKQNACMDWQIALQKGNTDSENYIKNYCK